MSRAVLKYRVPLPDKGGRAWIDMPGDAEPISVAMQEENMVIWALLPDQSEPVGPRRFIVANTGREIPQFPDGAKFLGTVTCEGIVWHVWDGDAETTA